jgi:hypothetical protein
MDTHAEHRALVADLTRRGFLQRAGLLGAGALVLSATPLAQRLVAEAEAQLPTLLPDATLEAFADTMIPGRKAQRTDLGNSIDPRAIAGVDGRPGAVEADVLTLYRHPSIGFDAVQGPFLSELQTRAAGRGGDFLSLSFDRRVEVCIEGLAFSNPTRVLWEAAAAVPFTAFCAAALVPEQRAEKASGYAVMGLPGAEPRGYPATAFSYRRKLARERTRKGYLP